MMFGKRMMIISLCLCLAFLTACQQTPASTAAPPDTSAALPGSTAELETMPPSATARESSETMEDSETAAREAATETSAAETSVTETSATETSAAKTSAAETSDVPPEETPEVTTPESWEESQAESSEPKRETAETADLSHLPPIHPQRGKTEMEQGWYESFNEGEDTPCQVDGYTERTGGLASYFLQPGDRIAVIAPSTLPSWGAVNVVTLGLQSWGYVPVPGRYVLESNRTLQNCIDDMIWALTDSSIRGIFCVCGGYGASEIMDSIPLDMVREAAKPIIGYSDISIFHAAWTVAGLPSIHGAMDRNFTNLAADCVSVMQRILRGERPVYHCAGYTENVPGQSEGVLIGGNLSTLIPVLNTAYDCTAIQEPYIIYFEDVTADMEQIHRFLTVLQHHGVLDRAAGIIFGEWIDAPLESEITDGSSRGGPFRSVADMIRRSFFPEADIPIAFGFPAGHGSINYPLLMGEKVRLQVGGEGVSLEWID